MSAKASAFSSHFSTAAPDYDVLLSDVWGVVHNGVAATANACDALRQFRAKGGTVVLITNAPRPGDFVQRFIDGLEVPRESYDAIVSSGDVTRSLIRERSGERVGHIGPPRDLPIFEGLGAALVPVENADYVVCSGLYDDTTEKPDDYDNIIATMLARKLPMICANPDIVVERGDRLIYCAGAIAELYRELGGEVIFYGKPHRPIYERALRLAAERRGGEVPLKRVLAIGDSVRTDLAGAHGFGIDCLFVTRGIHSEEFEGLDQLDPASVKELFGHPPRALMRELKW